MIFKVLVTQEHMAMWSIHEHIVQIIGQESPKGLCKIDYSSLYGNSSTFHY